MAFIILLLKVSLTHPQTCPLEKAVLNIQYKTIKQYFDGEHFQMY